MTEQEMRERVEYYSRAYHDKYMFERIFHMGRNGPNSKSGPKQSGRDVKPVSDGRVIRKLIGEF